MAITNGYCSDDELQEWNTSKKATAKLVRERAITASSRGIDHYCRRHFYQVTEARVFDACDPQMLELGEFGDVVTVTAVKTDENGDGVFETTWSASDYQVLPLRPTAAPEPEPYREIRAIGSRVFPLPVTGTRLGRIQVTGSPWGWPAIPADVNQACLMLAARIFKRKDSPEGVSGWGDFGMIRVGRTDPDVIALLAPYQLTPITVA